MTARKKPNSNDVTVDNNVRPQDDFFSYVNNPWVAANPMPPSESRWGTFNILRDQAWRNLKDIYESLQNDQQLLNSSIEQQARDFYYSAMHADGSENRHLKLIAKYFKDIDAVDDTATLSECIGSLQAVGIEAPWRIIIDPDDKDSTKHILRIRQGGLVLPNRDYYIDQTAKMRGIRRKYQSHLGKLPQYFENLTNNPELFKRLIIKFETAIAIHSRPDAALREAEENYNKTTYAALQHDYSNIYWTSYASALGWEPDDKISVDQPEFLAFVNSLFTSENLHEWKEYLKWQLLAPYYGRISERFAALKFEFFGKVLNGTSEILPQWKRAVLTIDQWLGPGVGKLYAKQHFPESSKLQVLELVESIREVYARRIERLDWMNPKTKKLALKKLANIKVLIGYPDKWRDYSDLKIGRDSYVENIMAATRFDYDYFLHRLYEPTSRDEWLMDPQTVNAYSDFNRLVICFPAAILQPPFFDPSASAVVNYGGIGTVIGHEFTHGFDDQGYKFDADGNLRAWQTEDDRTQFSKRAQVIIDQADRYEVMPGLCLNGNLVIGESIADLGGIEIAYEAIKSSPDLMQEIDDSILTEQLFFKSYALLECGETREQKKREYALMDPHPEASFRVNGILAHIDAFYNAFSLKKTDKLYRPSIQRAKIW